MRKMVPYYVIYVSLCFFLLSNLGIAITGSIISKVLIGLATCGLIGVTFETLHTDKKKQAIEMNLERELLQVHMVDKTKNIHCWQAYFSAMYGDVNGISAMLRDEISDAVDVSIMLSETIVDIQKLLSSNFSENDLTYTVYKEAIDNIEKTCCANFSSIERRLTVFKRDWDGNHALAKTYEREIQTYIQYNKEIGSKMEELTYELVRLSDNVQQGDADKITELIQQVQNYVNVRQEM